MTRRMVIFTFIAAAVLLAVAIYIASRTWWTIDQNELQPAPQPHGYTTTE